MAMYREGEYAAGATTRKGSLKQAKKVVNKALAKSAAQKKAAAKKAAEKKVAQKAITKARYVASTKGGSAAGGNVRASVRAAEKMVPAKTSSKPPRSAGKPTGAMDKNRRTY